MCSPIISVHKIVFNLFMLLENLSFRSHWITFYIQLTPGFSASLPALKESNGQSIQCNHLSVCAIKLLNFKTQSDYISDLY